MLLSSQQRVSGQVNPHGLYRPRVLSPKCQIVDAEACLQVVSTNLRVLRIGSPISRHLSYKANNLAHNGPRFAPQMAIQEVSMQLARILGRREQGYAAVRRQIF